MFCLYILEKLLIGVKGGGMRRSIFGLTALSTALWGAESSFDGFQQPQEEACCCGTSYHPYRVAVRHIEAKGIGYNTGYSTLEGFFSLPSDSWTPFLDLRGHLFNNGKFASNVGLGARYLNEEIDWAWGGNIYYDYRKTKHQSYNQIGIGLEALSPVWEVRANGYLPVSRKKSGFFDTGFHAFRGNHILLQRKREVALYGVDAEAGAHLLKCSDFDVFAGLGPYYFGAESGKDLLGGKFRLNTSWREYVSVEGSFSYDSIFKDIYQVQVALSFPLGRRGPIMKRSCSSCCTAIALDRRKVQPVVRDEIIVLERRKQILTAIDPVTQHPFQVWFVNNTSSSLGTFESPFPTLLAAQNASSTRDIIYVFPGDGTNKGMNQGILLKDYQAFLGAGREHALATTLGVIVVPPQANSSPLITNIAGSAVTLANGNTVSGFHIDQALLQGIAGIGIANATLTGNLITNVNTSNSANGAGVNLIGPGLEGIYLIQDNILKGETTNMQGIFTTLAGLDACSFTIINNMIETKKDGVQFKTLDSSRVTLLAQSNAISSTTVERAFFCETDNTSQLVCDFQNNQFSSASDVGLLMQGNNVSLVTGTVLGNQFNNSQTGLRIAPGTATYKVDFLKNTFTGNVQEDFKASVSDTTGSLCLSLKGNQAPDFGFILDKSQVGSTLNLTAFSENVGTLIISDKPITQNPLCP